MIKFLKYKKIYYTFSIILILGSIFSLAFFGLNFGIEFTGGSIMKVSYEEIRPASDDIKKSLLALGIEEVIVQPVDDNGFVIRMSEISKETYGKIAAELRGGTKDYFEFIGPAIGRELGDRALISIVLASLSIIIYIAVTFGGIGNQNMKSWKYGVIAVGLGFLHDVLIVLGFFTIFGYFFDVRLTIPIAVALLTVLGYSINDTVVIFDRIRENIVKNPKLIFSDIVEKSTNETVGRSINTSFTTLLVLIPVFFFGGEALKWFILAMIMGISLGTYSSLFLAGPLLVSWFNLNKKNV